MQYLAFFQNAVERVTGLGDASHRLAVDVDLRQDIFVAVSATRVGVGLVDELLDGGFAVAFDVCRYAFGDRDQAVIDYQRAKVGAHKLFLDNDIA